MTIIPVRFRKLIVLLSAIPFLVSCTNPLDKNNAKGSKVDETFRPGLDISIPSKPTNLTVESSRGSCSLSWSPSTTIRDIPITYTVSRSNVEGGSQTGTTVCSNQSTTTCIDSHSTTDSIYYYSVLAINEDGTTWSAEASCNSIYPTITSVSPITIGTWGDIPITIAGDSFSSGSSVTVGGQNCAISASSSSSITCLAPSGTSGNVDVVVTNSDGRSTTSVNAITYGTKNFNIVTSYYGSESPRGSADGVGRAARFNSPLGIAYDGSANLYIADTYSNTIRKMNLSTLNVTTVAGRVGTPGSTDGIGTSALFNNPTGLACDGTNLYIADTNNHTIRKMSLSTLEVTTLAGSAGIYGGNEGVGTAAKFNAPYGLLLDQADPNILYVADSINGVIRKIVISTQTVSKFASNYQATYGSYPLVTKVNANAWQITASTKLQNPLSMTSNGADIYLIDGHGINKIVITTQAITAIAGNVNMSTQAGYTEGNGTSAFFNSPFGIVNDGTNLYISDSQNRIIRKMVIATKDVTLYAGTPATKASSDGTLAAAKFDTPGAMVKVGNLIYLLEARLGQIRVIDTVGGTVSTLAGY